MFFKKVLSFLDRTPERQPIIQVGKLVGAVRWGTGYLLRICYQRQICHRRGRLNKKGNIIPTSIGLILPFFHIRLHFPYCVGVIPVWTRKILQKYAAS